MIHPTVPTTTHDAGGCVGVPANDWCPGRPSTLSTVYAPCDRDLKAAVRMTIPDDDGVDAPEVSLTPDLAKTLARLVQFAVAALDDCDTGDVTVLHGAGAITVAATDGLAIALDEAQYAADDGPCLDAARQQRINVIGSTLRESRWPRFCREATSLGLSSFE